MRVLLRVPLQHPEQDIGEVDDGVEVSEQHKRPRVSLLAICVTEAEWEELRCRLILVVHE